MSAPIEFTRNQLYKYGWSEPVAQVGARFGVSDVAIARICKKMNIPRPARGYWAKKQHGYPVGTTPLPKATSNTPLKYVMYPTERHRSSRPVVKPPKVDVPERLGRTHVAVRAIRSGLKGCHVDDFVRIGRSDGPLHVSKSSYSRACRILDALFKALESRSHRVELNDNQICISIQSETVHLAVNEPTRRIEGKPDAWGYRQWEYLPTGKLVLALSARYLQGVRQQWGDGKVQRVEDLLGRLVIALEQAPEVIRTGREEAERQEREWARERLRRRRQNDAIRLIHERAGRIDQLSADLIKARQIRRFVKAVDGSASAHTSVVRLARWAVVYADHIDPLVDFESRVLSEEPLRSYF